MARKRVFARDRAGAVTVSLYPQEVEVLARTARDLVPILEAPPEGAVHDRLYPRAYLDPTEESAQVDYDALAHGDLAATRRAAIDAVVTALERTPAPSRGLVRLALGDGEEMQWLTALNDARLVLGTTLGVTEDDDLDYAPDDPRYELAALYGFLTALHFDLVELLLDEIGPGGTDDTPDAG